MRKIMQILICSFLIFTLIPITSALNNIDETKIENSSNPTDSGIMVGIMHIEHVKKGWGWIEVWQPTCIFVLKSNERHFLGPLSVSFTPLDIKGFLGPRYFIRSYSLREGFFFICANVIIYE